MKKFGLIGYPLTHSFSKKYFTEKFAREDIEDNSYELFELENLSNFPEFIKANPDLCGLNVTIPHKIGAVFYMNWMDDEAKKVEAINCIKIITESAIEAAFSGEVGFVGQDFRLEGYNTDIYGFEHSLKPLLKSQHNKALVLGNGGASRAVRYVLKKLRIPFQVVSRRPKGNHLLYQNVTPELIKTSKLIINTTPLGTAPDLTAFPPIPYGNITDQHLLYDLIYNPEKTVFLQKGEAQGATIKNGYEMLVLQAEKSWEIWNKKAIL
ncbi:shikimate dehydrogenase family protein [Mucilaginibacter arboris]|uniref:Shikimate dehydrogenase n=1 Tax=Mucilaginibacter arboris TaxID=2682090 RepID=A0A7K1SSB4_9SPHI|nr:shikimate dehydrogenase [Mucilaginibacter arboris]MVN20203.1 shikimate dehydrogenase [Mucilaginibacter arboris]